MNDSTNGFHAVVFDFDGTIFDTEVPTFTAWSETYRRHGAELDAELWRAVVGSHGRFDAALNLAELTGGRLEPEALRESVRARVRELCADTPLPGVEERIAEARMLGLKLGIASSSSSGWVEGWLGRLGLEGAFDCVCGRDHVERVKPAPDLFLLVARRLGVEPAACLVFEDSPNGVLAARGAGMRCVAVPNEITRHASFPEATELVLDSLADASLVELLRRLAA